MPILVYRENGVKFLFRIAFIFFIILCIFSGCAGGVKAADLANEYYNIGNSYYNLKQFDDARKFYERALELNPRFYKAKYNLAMSLIKLNRTEDAIPVLEDIRNKDSNNIDVLSTLTYLYYQTAKYEKALITIDQILAIAPQSVFALYNGGIIYWKLKKIDKAISLFIQLKEIQPDDQDIVYNLGNLYYIAGNYEKAVEYFLQYIEKKPGDGNSYLFLARCYSALEKYLLALEAYDRAVVILPKNKDIWFEKAVILLTKVMDPAKGLTMLTQAIELGFNDADKFKALLENPALLDREKIEAFLKEKNVYPPPAKTSNEH
jgi:tetratricopeptide (TPR) repeat protein